MPTLWILSSFKGLSHCLAFSAISSCQTTVYFWQSDQWPRSHRNEDYCRIVKYRHCTLKFDIFSHLKRYSWSRWSWAEEGGIWDKWRCSQLQALTKSLGISLHSEEPSLTSQLICSKGGMISPTYDLISKQYSIGVLLLCGGLMEIWGQMSCDHAFLH